MDWSIHKKKVIACPFDSDPLHKACKNVIELSFLLLAHYGNLPTLLKK